MPAHPMLAPTMAAEKTASSPEPRTNYSFGGV